MSDDWQETGEEHSTNAQRRLLLTDEQKTRFHAKYRRGEGCWMWTGCVDKDGYGRHFIAGIRHKAHRIACLLAYGEWPADMCVCHKCDTPGCVNPAHFFLGTNADNQHDKMKKGRGRWLVGEDRPMAKLTAQQVTAIRSATGTHAAIAARFGVSGSNVTMIRNRRTWAHLL